MIEVIIILAFGIAIVNFWLGLGRVSIFYLFRYPNKKLKYSSGFPLVGQLMAIIGLLLTNDQTMQWLAIVTIIADTGGIHFFLYSLLFKDDGGSKDAK